jgi:hypothetical protein
MSDDPVAALSQAVASLTTTVAVLTEATNGLKRSVDDLRRTSVSQHEHAALVANVVELKADVERLPSPDAFKAVQQGVDRNDLRWNRVLWGIAAVVGLALLGTVVVQGGTKWASADSLAGLIPSWSEHSLPWSS